MMGGLGVLWDHVGPCLTGRTSLTGRTLSDFVGGGGCA